MSSELDRKIGDGIVSPYQTRVLAPAKRLKYQILVAIWSAMIVYFWVWWFEPAHIMNPDRYVIVSLAIGWVFMLQLYFIGIFLRATRAKSQVGELGPARVAMVVTKTPSEPFSLVRATLKAMLAQDYPHDTWLADEDPDEETIKWCEQNGVRISTRKGVDEYHQSDWPRRTKSKEGNLTYFYDKYGYENYDFVSQMDADHVPQAGYLSEILKPFADPEVGYVSAPSICSGNADKSWAARTRLYSEAMFHGVLQSGYSNGWAPMCIGSHYAVRTSALKEIGGLGPELAEDHSTSMMMNAKGWRGVHAIDAIAIGDGPATFADMLTQEFQWSRSLFTIFLRYTPRYLAGLPYRLKFQFVFSQLWYPMFAGFMLLTFLIPILALVFDVRFAEVTYPAFIGHSAPATIALIVIAYQIRKDGFFRPFGAKVISWERALFACAQWPWVFWGSFMATLDSLTGKTADFRITPKGKVATGQLPNKVIAPYFLLALFSILPVLLLERVENAAGFYLLALINAAIYSTLVAVIVIKHVAENGIKWQLNPIYHAIQFTTAAALIAMTMSSVWYRGTESLHFLSSGLEPLQLTKAQFPVSGAGQSEPGTVQYRIIIEWDE